MTLEEPQWDYMTVCLCNFKRVIKSLHKRLLAEERQIYIHFWYLVSPVGLSIPTVQFMIILGRRKIDEQPPLPNVHSK